jgi:hypothetical protein
VAWSNFNENVCGVVLTEDGDNSDISTQFRRGAVGSGDGGWTSGAGRMREGGGGVERL